MHKRKGKVMKKLQVYFMKYNLNKTDPQRVALLEEERQRIRNRQFAQYTGKNKYQVDLS